MRKFGVAVGLALVVAWGSWLLAAPAVGPVAITPATAVVGVPTVVTVTALIEDPLLIPASVNLQQIDATGKVVAIVGTLRDDGTNGDVVAGDKVFSARVTLNEAQEGSVSLRVSAAFKGLLMRVFSPTLTVRAAQGEAVAAVGAAGQVQAPVLVSLHSGVTPTSPPGSFRNPWLRHSRDGGRHWE